MTDQTDHPTDPVQAVAEVLGCKRVTDRNGTAYCAEHNFGWLRDANACPRAERAAEVVLAAARPAIEREAKAERDTLAARLAAVEALFAGGPDTPCRTLWRATEGLIGEWAEIECVEVPLDELRAAFATGTTTNQQEADQ